MNSELTSLLHDTLRKLKGLSNAEALERLRFDVLGRSGKLAAISRKLPGLPERVRREEGKLLNRVKKELMDAFNEKFHAFSKDETKSVFIDYTLPGSAQPLGTLHPLRAFIDRITGLFMGMGYEVVDGNEVETEEYNFDLLNVPFDHPARDLQDTFHLDTKENWVLRTHTSNMQVRAMLTRKPPVRIVSPGRVFRHEATDASHEAMFYQIEGFVVDRDVRLTDLLGTLKTFLTSLFGDVKVRFRPHYYPFVEPGLDVDMSCLICSGKGCSVCKRTGWLEMLGSGMIHPTVLKNMKVNPKIWSGFAFGLGVDRFMMLYYGIDDIRLPYQGDVRFTRQFLI